MKQRIITGVVAAALFIPFVMYGGIPFAILMSVIAVIGFYELLKMRNISIFSAPGLIGTLALFMLVIPTDWSKEIIGFLNYESNLMIIYGIVILLLM